jgi:hypothetical protein
MESSNPDISCAVTVNLHFPDWLYSVPATWHGGTSTLLVRGLNEDGVELDRITLARASR